MIRFSLVKDIISDVYIVGAMRPQVILGNMLRPGVPPVSFPNPIQRPVGGVQPSRPQRPMRPQSTPAVSTPSSQTISDMKAKQRQALIAHTQSFLNPDNKPRMKSKVEVSAKDEKTSILSTESSNTDVPEGEKK